MPQATFLHGKPLMVDYTPGSAVNAGDVIVTADTPRVAHLDIPANTLGALAAEGGVYTMTANAAIGADKKVWWDSATGKVTTTAGSLKAFGMTVSASGADNDPINVRHDPSA